MPTDTDQQDDDHNQYAPYAGPTERRLGWHAIKRVNANSKTLAKCLQSIGESDNPLHRLGLNLDPYALVAARVEVWTIVCNMLTAAGNREEPRTCAEVISHLRTRITDRAEIAHGEARSTDQLITRMWIAAAAGVANKIEEGRF